MIYVKRMVEGWMDTHYFCRRTHQRVTGKANHFGRKYLHRNRQNVCVSMEENRAIVQKYAPVARLGEVGIDIVGSW